MCQIAPSIQIMLITKTELYEIALKKKLEIKNKKNQKTKIWRERNPWIDGVGLFT